MFKPQRMNIVRVNSVRLRPERMNIDRVNSIRLRQQMMNKNRVNTKMFRCPHFSFCVHVFIHEPSFY